MSAEKNAESLAKDANTGPLDTARFGTQDLPCIGTKTFRVPTKTFAMFARHLNAAMLQFREDVEVRTARDVKLRVGTINPVGEHALVTVCAYGRM